MLFFVWNSQVLGYINLIILYLLSIYDITYVFIHIFYENIEKDKRWYYLFILMWW